MMVLILLACSAEPQAPAAPAPPPQAAVLPGPVARAVELARIVQADPAGADAALTAKGSSRAELEGLLYDIAKDPALTDAYAKAMGR